MNGNYAVAMIAAEMRLSRKKINAILDRYEELTKPTPEEVNRATSAAMKRLMDKTLFGRVKL